MPELLSINLSIEICGKEIDPLILGDSAYSLENWLMKPYSDRGNLSEEEWSFNFSLSRSHVLENAFGRLKGRFQCLAKQIDTTVEHTVSIVTMCYMLHNFCILSNQEFLEKWMQIDVNWVRGGDNQRCIEIENEAKLIRSAIKLI